MTVSKSIVLLSICALVGGCLPSISTSFSIVERADPLSDVPALEKLCKDLGLKREDAVGPPQPAKGTFVCTSQPGRGYFIVFTPAPDKREVEVYFAEVAHDFSAEARSAYSSLVRKLQEQYGDSAGRAPAI